ncbi:hypothetical protein I4U23_029239 [Adineta vaga]|nr:hypothetical protein I4U23_029239 [Adineta vaga]
MTNEDDSQIDEYIDQYVIQLKVRDNQTNVPRTDDVYLECLIRSRFNEDRAFFMLNHHRPNLKPPVDESIAQKPSKISLNQSVEYLRQQFDLLNKFSNKNSDPAQLSSEKVVSRNVQHLLPAIRQLYQKNNNQSENEILFSKMCRLIYAELSRSIGPQLPVKIETLARLLCDAETEIIENLDLVTLENLASLNKLTCIEKYEKITSEKRTDFFVWLESKIGQWFQDKPDLIKLYHRNLFIASAGKDIKKCGNTKCESYFITDDNNQDIRAVYCPDCNYAQCCQCTKKWYSDHIDKDCDEYNEWLIDHDPEDEGVRTILYLRDTAIVCPNKECGTICEYEAGGCEHFTCPQCKTDFCRMCSTLFCSPKKGQNCKNANCNLGNTLHAHCSLNCFRETRIGEINAILKLLADHQIDGLEELRKSFESPQEICSISGCNKVTSAICEKRLCENCYKQFLCSLIWRYRIEPWDIYEDNNLQQMLKRASVAIPNDSTRNNLILLCKQNLKELLGKPKTLRKPRVLKT